MGLGISLGIGWCGCNGTSSVPCNSVVTPGGAGITDNTIALDPSGGVVTIMFTAYGIPDKIEIIHGNSSGTKVATSGMTTLNAGPFDNTYGTEPSNTVPTGSETLPIDQFIGTNKGSIPNRAAAYTLETGNASPLVAPYQQLIWWVYDAADYQASTFVTIRVTGPQNTGWQFERVC